MPICGIHHTPHPTAADVRECYRRRAAGEAATYGRPLWSSERARATEAAAASIDRFARYDSLIAEREQATDRDAYAMTIRVQEAADRNRAFAEAREVWCDFANERALAPGGFCNNCGSTSHKPYRIDPVFAATKAGRSKLREVAQRQGERLQKFQSLQPTRTPVKGDGVFRLGDDFFQVKRAVHGSGRLYANRFNPATRSWEYASGALRRLAEEDRLSAAEAAKFGQLYGECIRCHRTLTDQESIDRGMGRDCAGKAGYFA
jgi:hypothetical protein